MFAAFILAIGLTVYHFWPSSSHVGPDVQTHTVNYRTLRDTVVEMGTLESQKTVYGHCDLPGWENKVIYIIPEGTHVEKDDVVVRFDDSTVRKMVDDQKIKVNDAEGLLAQAEQELQVQLNKNESDIAAADLALTLAKLDLDKYREGELKATDAEYEMDVKEAEAELEKIKDEVENMRALIKRGFRSPEQLRELTLRQSSLEFRVERNQQRLSVLRKFEAPRKITELEANAKEAERKLERAKTTADAETKKAENKIASAKTKLELEKQQLQQAEKTLTQCEVKAPQSGTVAYANNAWMYGEDRIREGATVRSNQNIFYLPDMSLMQVKVNVHESVINKVKAGQSAIIRVDSYPDQVFSGIVKTVSQLASTSYNTEAKAYEVLVLIDKIPDGILLKPGMTAEVEVQCGTYENIIAVPVNAITEHGKKSFAYVLDNNEFVKSEVSVGRVTQSFVEVTSGLNKGQVVAARCLSTRNRRIRQRGAVAGRSQHQADRTNRGQAQRQSDDGRQRNSVKSSAGRDRILDRSHRHVDYLRCADGLRSQHRGRGGDRYADSFDRRQLHTPKIRNRSDAGSVPRLSRPLNNSGTARAVR